MYPISLSEIEELAEDDLKKLSKLDSQGILIGPGEGLGEFKKRLTTALDTQVEVDKELDSSGTFELYKGMDVRREERIPTKLLDQVCDVTKKKYKFSVNWVSGFFLSKSLGFLWGGCSISFPVEQFTVFLIRKNFKDAAKWFIYSRDELLSHEICHVARAPIHDNPYEEHFAYAISQSGLRRQIGNCFQSQIDALLFICPVFTLLAVQFYQVFTRTQFSLVPFWLFAASGPLYLLVKNYFLRFKFFRAVKKLERAGYKNVEAILFRCTKSEIFDFAASVDVKALVEQKFECDLRWRVIRYRFIK